MQSTYLIGASKVYRYQLKKVTLLLMTLFLGALYMSAQEPVHDPSAIIKGDDNRYYVFSTGDGIYGLSSSNPEFTNYREEPTPIDPNNYPSWIDSYVSNFGGNFWAPGIIYMDGYYYLYYSASSFGTSRSVIGVTRTPSLSNPSWEDQGMVVHSSGGREAINAIDPAMLRDTDGKIWMSYGSFHGGIGIIEIDPSTGKTKGSLTHLAGGNHRDYEAPYIIKNGGYYYLFINRGRCCDLLNSTYSVQVSRSTNVTGPYSGVREFLPAQLGNIVGPGHIGYGEGVLSYHYYDGFSNGYPRLFTTTLDFVDGWPVAGSTGIEMAHINGNYALIAEHSNKAISMETSPAINGTNIVQSSYFGDDSQSFIIKNEEGIWHSIKPAVNTAVSLDVFEVSTDNGANINLWEYRGGVGQQFSFMLDKSGGYRIINRNSNRCIDVSNASKADGANILQWGCFANAPQQTFRLVDLSTTGIDVVEATETVIFPNPSSGFFIIRSKTDHAKIEIINNQGQRVHKSFVGVGNNEINTLLSPGIYFVMIESSKGVVSHKLVIK